MRWLFCIVTFCFFSSTLYSQNISGKWYGKAFQGPGELCTTCDFELTLDQKRNISGESYTYIKDSTDIRIGLRGYFDKDTIRLQEDPAQIINDLTPPKWQICIKKIMVKYQVLEGQEYLIGRGTGETLDFEPCIPAKFIFARTLEDLNRMATVYRDSISNIIVPPFPEFTSDFNSTIVSKVNELIVNHRDLQIQLSDYEKIDNDTVTVYLNRAVLSGRIRISRAPVKINFHLDDRSDRHELLLYAENLGKIPPNTSLMEIIDGNKRYRIKIESDKQKTAAIYLRFKPDPNE